MPHAGHGPGASARRKAAGSVILLHGLAANRRVDDVSGERILPATDCVPMWLICPAMAIARTHFRSRARKNAPLPQWRRFAQAETSIRRKTSRGPFHGRRDRRAHGRPRSRRRLPLQFRLRRMSMPRRMPAESAGVQRKYRHRGVEATCSGSVSRRATGNRDLCRRFRTAARISSSRLVPHSTHTSVLCDRRVAHQSELWAMRGAYSLESAAKP